MSRRVTLPAAIRQTPNTWVGKVPPQALPPVKSAKDQNPLLHPNTNAHRNLPVRDLVVFDMASRLEDLEPAKIFPSLRKLGYRVLHRIFNARL